MRADRHLAGRCSMLGVRRTPKRDPAGTHPTLRAVNDFSSMILFHCTILQVSLIRGKLGGLWRQGHGQHPTAVGGFWLLEWLFSCVSRCWSRYIIRCHARP